MLSESFLLVSVVFLEIITIIALIIVSARYYHQQQELKVLKEKYNDVLTRIVWDRESVQLILYCLSHTLKTKMYALLIPLQEQKQLIQLGLSYNWIRSYHTNTTYQAAQSSYRTLLDLELLIQLRLDGLVQPKKLHSLSKIWHNIYNRNRQQIQSCHVRITTDINNMIFGDISLIERVLEELLDNSLQQLVDKKTAKISTIILNSQYINGATQVNFIDHEITLEQRQVKTLFEPTTRITTHSSGLGFAICKQVIILHHGSLAVKSLKPNGVQFTLYFPLPKDYEHL